MFDWSSSSDGEPDTLELLAEVPLLDDSPLSGNYEPDPNTDKGKIYKAIKSIDGELGADIAVDFDHLRGKQILIIR